MEVDLMIIGAVPYLNTRPLIQYFLDHPDKSAHRLIFAVPSQLVEMLLARKIDVAIPSAFSLFAFPGLALVPEAGIVSYGPVLSCRIFMHVPVEGIRTVALDASSLSSVALARILLKERFGVAPVYISLPPDPQTMLARADACVLIGDPALRALLAGYESLDLAEEWHRLTGFPFVFAAWIARAGEDLKDLSQVLRTAKQYGMAHLEEIALREAQRLGFPPEFCQRYLTQAIRYDLGQPEFQGLACFRELCARHGIVSEPEPIQIYSRQ